MSSNTSSALAARDASSSALQDNSRQSLFLLGPERTVTYATEVAGFLNSVILKQNLFVELSGRKYVKIEGWTTLGTMLGVLPQEEWTKELEDGSYEAKVQLVNQSTGMVVGSATSYCGMDEKRWGKAEKYARRSMAVTRATGKAYRITFGWIIALAGFEATPSDEMPIDDKPEIKIETFNKSHWGMIGPLVSHVNLKREEKVQLLEALEGCTLKHVPLAVMGFLADLEEDLKKGAVEPQRINEAEPVAGEVIPAATEGVSVNDVGVEDIVDEEAYNHVAEEGATHG